MALIADFLMAAGAFGAAIYCFVLSGRLKRFTALETGMGGAIAVLSAQVDDMTRALESARGAAHAQTDGLRVQTARAEAAAAQLELLLASLHDLPPAAGAVDSDDADRRLRFVRRRGGAADLEAAE